MRMDLWAVPSADGSTLGAVVQFRYRRRLFTPGQPVYEAPKVGGFASVLAVPGTWLVLQVCWLLCMLMEYQSRSQLGLDQIGAYLVAVRTSKCRSSPFVSTAKVIAKNLLPAVRVFYGG